MPNVVDVFSKLMELESKRQGLGAAGGYGGLGVAPAAGRFFGIFWKEGYFNTIEFHFARVQSYLKKQDF